jgi:membrane glycosyltransferase
MSRLRSPEPALFLALFTGASILLPPVLAGPGTALWALLLLELLLLGFALDLAELFAAVLVGDRDLPRLPVLLAPPRTAILLLVCDDFVPEALAALQSAAPDWADLFLLDDSTEPVARSLLYSSGLQVVRRPDRQGHKAGSLNYWLRLHGLDYDYFLVLDSDSLIAPGFVETLVRAAEHPDNARIAIFNSLPRCWNTRSRFARLLSAVWPIRNWIRMRLANRSATVFSSGHNNLHRTSPLLAIGGFAESFVAEDIVVTLDLLRAGYTSQLVGVEAWEAEPEHVFSYVKRIERWARQTVQVQRADWTGIPPSLTFQMFKLTWGYLSFFLYPICILAIAWGARSSLADVRSYAAALLWGTAQARTSLLAFAVALSVSLAAPVLKLPLARRLGVPIGDFAKSHLLSLAIVFYSMLAVCRALLAAAAVEEIAFEVTDKHRRKVTFSAVLLGQWPLALFWILLFFGFSQNPLAFLFSAGWMALLLLAPAIVYLAHGSRDERVALSGQGPK